MSSLIDFDDSYWNSSLLRRMFEANIAITILAIPLSDRWPVDLLYWWPLNDGLYSVKSGYKVEMSKNFKCPLFGTSRFL